ncbi:OmpA family protein [Paraburkholderia kururiensis]|uniref:OmpA family protein n=1 Tax=Paraburkholderia kururiensis TaxID=984307 RepID=UPI000349237B|nr:OmpA family protein [Paraburkholderia kururiensis]
MTYPDILRTLHNLVATPVSEQAPPFLGEARSDVKDAVDSLLPNLLAAIIHRGLATPSGADALTAVLDSPRLDRSLVRTNLDNYFSGGAVTDSNMKAGSALLAELFGDRVPAMDHAAASMSHLKLESGHALLAMVAPFAFAVLRHAWVTGPDGASRASLVSLLHAQRQAIHPRLLDRFLLALGIPSAVAWLDSTLEPQAAVARPVTAMPSGAKEEDRPRHRVLWAILLLLILAALLALAYCTNRIPGADKTAATTAPVVLVRPASSPEPASSTPAASAASTPDAASEPASSPAATLKPGPAPVAPLLEVRFGYASAALPADFARTASEWIAYAKDHADATFEVSGFADNTGEQALNERLADRRAEAVMAALVKAGVGAAQLSKGASQVVSETTDATVARRAEVRPKP